MQRYMFRPRGEKDLYIKVNSKALNPFGGHSDWTFHIKKDMCDDCYCVKLKWNWGEVIDSFCSLFLNSN